MGGCGYPREQAVGVLLWEGPWWRPSAERAARIRDACGRAAAGEPFRDELPYALAGGEERFALVTIVPLRDGADRGASLAATGTDARRAERRLAEEEERLRLTVESLADYAIVGLDPSGRIVGWNRGAEQIFGYPAAEILGADFSALFTVEDRGRGVPEAELRSAAASGRGEDGRWHLRRDGSRFYAAGFVVPALDAAGALRG